MFAENENKDTPCDCAEKQHHKELALNLESRMVFSRDPEAESIEAEYAALDKKEVRGYFKFGVFYTFIFVGVTLWKNSAKYFCRYYTLYCVFVNYLILTQRFIAFKLSSENITNTLSKLKRSFILVLNYVDCLESVAGCEAGENTVRPVSWETVSLKHFLHIFIS